jgi:hypothetical protein
MPSNFSSQETLNGLIEKETRALHKAESYVRLFWAAFTHEPTNKSLATLYGALVALAEIYRKVGIPGAVPTLLAKLEPALFHILEHSDRFDFEYIYPHIDILMSVGDFSRARKIALRSIKLIMSKNKDLTIAARQILREQLESQFMNPIEVRKQWHEDSIHLTDSITFPAEWFAIIPREDGLQTANWSFGVVNSAWNNDLNSADDPDNEPNT